MNMGLNNIYSYIKSDGLDPVRNLPCVPLEVLK